MHDDAPILPNFKLSDFQCHGAECAHDSNRLHSKNEVMAGVQAIRDFLGEPLRVTRGVSCAIHNKAAGGAPDSRHLPEHRDAVDIACADSQEAYRIVNAAIRQRFFTTLRVYAGHVHLDARLGPYSFIASPE